MPARSFLVTAPEGDALARALTDAHRSVERPTAGLVFVSGLLARQAVEIGALLAKVWKGVPAIIVPSAGVLSDRGEIERASAASGVLFSGGRAEPLIVRGEGEEPAQGLRDAWSLLGTALRPRTLVLFARPDVLGLDTLDGMASFAPDLCIFGAGTVGGPPVAVSASGKVEPTRIAGLAIGGIATPLVEATPAVRLLSAFETIDEASAGMIVRIGDRPALEALSAAAAGLQSSGASSPQPLVFVALADESSAPDAPVRFAVRNIRGIDPGRRGLVIGPEVRNGMRCAFAVLDGAEARADLDRTTKRVAEGASGSAPVFGLFMSCAGRGSGLYGAPEIESRALRRRFGDLPIAGMQSAFEIAPWGPGRAKLQFFTGVLALFRSPS